MEPAFDPDCHLDSNSEASSLSKSPSSKVFQTKLARPVFDRLGPLIEVAEGIEVEEEARKPGAEVREPTRGSCDFE